MPARERVAAMSIRARAHQWHVAIGARHIARVRLFMLMKGCLHQRWLFARGEIRKRKLMTRGACSGAREIVTASHGVRRRAAAGGAREQMIADDMTGHAAHAEIGRAFRHWPIGRGLWRMTTLAERQGFDRKRALIGWITLRLGVE